ncbi:MAG: hypothetical protein KGI08_04305 [Thaumarchaeota archaeon]|nr:hypothetical protein [Nitrososphaerota archaeon]
MKGDRDNKWTTGICDIIDDDRNKRVCFFEIDGFNALELFEVIGQYYKFGLDVLVHRTGNGFHFLSPTMVNLTRWKEFHDPLRHINSECPMVCMRIEANKWPDEEKMWKNVMYFQFTRNPEMENIRDITIQLEKYFLVNISGRMTGKIKMNRYPLPTKITCRKCNKIMDKVREATHICVTK